jgi:predicted PurR-regulated permease PerM
MPRDVRFRVPRVDGLPGQAADARARRRRATVAFAILAALVVGIIYAAREILLPVIIAGVVAYLFAPSVDRAQRWHIPRWVTVLVTYILFFAGVYGFGVYLVPKLKDEAERLVVQLRHLAENAPGVASKLEGAVGGLVDVTTGTKPEPEQAAAPPALLSVEEERERDLAERRRGAQFLLERLDDGAWGATLNGQMLHVEKLADDRWQVTAKHDSEGPVKGEALKKQIVQNLKGGAEKLAVGLVGDLLKLAQGLVTGVLSGLVQLVVTLMIAAYILIDLPRLRLFYRHLVPWRWRRDYDELVQRLNDGLSGVVRGQLIICVINGVLSGIGFALFIPDYAVVLGLFAGILTLIPIFGTVISSIPAVLVALVDGWGTAAAVLGWILGIHFFEANVWNPKIIGSQAHIHPVIVVVSLVFGEHFFGLKGALLAVPVVAILRAIYMFTWKRVRRDWTGDDGAPSSGPQGA